MDISLLDGWRFVAYPPPDKRVIKEPALTLTLAESHQFHTTVKDSILTVVFDPPEPAATRTLNNVFADWMLHQFTTVDIGRIATGPKIGTEVYDTRGIMRGMCDERTDDRTSPIS